MAFAALAGLSGLGQSAQGFTGALGDIFGGSTAIKGTGTKAGTVTEQLEIDEAGVQKILSDILGSEQGLANIFSEEQVSGLFSSSVSKQAAGDLLTNLAGEIAKLTAKKTTTTDLETTEGQKTEEAGLLKTVGSLFGF